MKKISYKIAMSIFLLISFSLNLQAVSQIKIICDMNGEEIYLNGKFKSGCDKDEVVRLLVNAGKYRVVVKKSTKEGRYSYVKNIRLGDGIQKTVVVKATPVYSEYHYYKQAVDQESLSACNEYKERYPHGKYLRGIKELEAYIAAKKDFKNVARYEKLYPHGKFLSRIADYYIKNPLIATQKGVKAGALALSKNSRFFYSAGGNPYVENFTKWDLLNKKRVMSITHKNKAMSGPIGVNTMDLTPDERYAYSDGLAGTIKWDLVNQTREVVSKLNPCVIKYLGNNKILLFNSGSFKIYDLLNKKVLYKYVGDERYGADMYACVLSKDKRFLFFGRYFDPGRKQMLVQFDLVNKRTVKRFKGDFLKDSTYSLAITQDQKYLVSGSGDCSHYTKYKTNDDTITIWDIGTSKPIKFLKQKGYVNSIDISSDGKLLATASNEKLIKLWDFKSGALLKTIYTSYFIEDIKFTKDGNYLLVALDKSRINIYCTRFYNKKNVLKSHLRECRKGDIKACSDYLFFGGKQIRVAKGKILQAISSVLKNYGSKMVRGYKKVYISDRENFDYFKSRGNYSKYTVQAIATSGNKTYVLMNMYFYNTGFRFNSPIYLVQNGKKKNYSKKYPADKYVGFRGGSRGTKDVKVVFVFDNFPLSRGRYKLIENTGTCNGCLNCDNGNIVKIF